MDGNENTGDHRPHQTAPAASVDGERQFSLPAGLYLSSEETGGVKVGASGGRESVRETQVKATGEGSTRLVSPPRLPRPPRQTEPTGFPQETPWQHSD